MTNLFNLSQKQLPKLIFIHGLNNNNKAMALMRNHYESMGFICSSVILPGHGKIRHEARDFKTAFRHFNEAISKEITSPYIVIAFSQGALYFQLWLEKNSAEKPLAQVLLAPALFIKNETLIRKLTNILPHFFPIPSISPRHLRRYMALRIDEYKTLLDGIKIFQNLPRPFPISTLILIDPRDELVSAKHLNEHVLKQNRAEINFEHFERAQLKNNLGQHHILFHPEYFTGPQWEEFNLKICQFLKKTID